MNETPVEFFSEGTMVAGLLRTPDHAGNGGGIVQGPGWLGLKDAQLYLPYHEALTHAGFTVLIIDYRGFGNSGPGTLSPTDQLADLTNAVTFLMTLDAIEHVSVFGSGGTGGGNAVLLAAHDRRISCVVSQVPVADGMDWLRRMRTSEEAWQSFLSRLEEDRLKRVLIGKGTNVHPREEIMIPSAERRTTTVKSDVDGRIPSSVPLAAADEILAYQPGSIVHTVRGLMVVAVDNDVVTPTDHAVALFEGAPTPKRLVMQYNTTHYAAYKEYGDEVIPLIVDWFIQHMSGPVGSASERIEVGR